ADQMPDQMPCCIRKSIETIKRGHGKTFDIAPHTPPPKTVCAINAKTLGCLVPEAEVEFDSQRHFRIVIVSVGAPSGHFDQRREMIARRFCLPAERLVTERLDRF